MHLIPWILLITQAKNYTATFFNKTADNNYVTGYSPIGQPLYMQIITIPVSI